MLFTFCFFINLKTALTVSFPKSLLYIILAIGITNYLFAQKPVQNPTFNFYLPVANLDSLEGRMLKYPKNTINYIDLLLKYEHSYLVRHDIHSKYYYDLLRLNKVIENPARKAMVNFLIGWQSVKEDPGNQISYLSNALNHFEAVGDTAGMANCYGLMIWLSSSILPKFESNFWSKKYMKKLDDLADNSSDLGVQSIHFFYSNDFVGNVKKRNSYEQTVRELKQLISKVQQSPAYKAYLNSLYNIENIIHSREKKYRLALNSNEKIEIEKLPDSYTYILKSLNLGYCYYKLEEFERASYFYKIVVDKANLENTDLIELYGLAFEKLGVINQKNDPVKAIDYFKKSIKFTKRYKELEIIKKNSESIALIDLTHKEKTIRAITTEKLHIERQNQQIKLLLGFGILLLLVISLLVLRFYQINIRLKNITRSRDKLFTIISHDLRSPLGAYMGMAETVNFLLKTKKYKRLLQMSQQMDLNAQKLNLIMSNLFRWSMAELENIKPSLLNHNLEVAISPTLEVYRSIATLKQLNFQIDLPEHLNISTDRNLFVTIISNLLDNAIKFCSPSGTVSLHIEKLEHNTRLNLSNDFSLESNPDFMPIEQLINHNKTFTYGERGMGLGLLLVKEFADALHLPINFKTENQKAIFEIDLTKTIKTGD
jgi:signal transduction histidine kinase